jgi:hypothetical protein
MITQMNVESVRWIKKRLKMIYCLKFYGCFNVSTIKVLLILRTLKKKFNENYIDIDNIYVAFL